MENLRPNGKRAKIAITLIWIILALEIIALIFGYFQYDLIQTAASGGEISTEDVTANDTRILIIGTVYSIAFVISIVTFIQWFRRAYFNLHQRVNHLSHNEGWAAGCWFVPIVCLYVPYQIMRELYQETKELLIKKGFIISENFRTRPLAWWWTLWIINNIFGEIIFKFVLKTETIDELTTSTIASMIGNVIKIPLALITVKVIKDYSNLEPMLFETKEEEEETTTL